MPPTPINTIHPKVTGSILGGAVSVVLVWMISTIFTIEIPPNVAQSITVVCSGIGGWLTPSD